MSEETYTPAWMLTFGDFMGLLVTFFVMLITFSKMEDAKLTQLVGAMRGGFGIVPSLRESPFRETSLSRTPEPALLSADRLSPVSLSAPMMLKRFQDIAEAERTRILVRLVDEGMAILIHTAPVFEEGGAGLKRGNDALFTSVGNIICDIANEVRITAVVPEDIRMASAEWRSPWGLAAARALAFEKGLCTVCGFSCSRFGIGAEVQDAESAALRPDLPAERIEVLIVEKRRVREVSPQEAIIFDQWE